jgi:hypothetical protein
MEAAPAKSGALNPEWAQKVFSPPWSVVIRTMFIEGVWEFNSVLIQRIVYCNVYDL